MVSATSASAVDQIGEVAGQVWRCLEDHGQVSMTRLVKLVDAPRDVVMQAVGWLAREDKIEIDESSRSRQISLRQGF